MNKILELATKLQDTSAAIANHERAIADNPSLALTASLRSLQKRLSSLEIDFSALAAGRGVDVCRYRFFSDYVQPTLNPVCGALIDFQSVYTYAYDAIKNGVKQIARISEDVVQETTFGFGYSFSGSLGIVLTFDNRKLDLLESYMDDAMVAVFELARATTTDEVAECGRRVGPPTVKALYSWASVHVQYGLGAEVQWVRGDTVKSALYLDVPSLHGLLEVLDNTSDIKTEIVELEGMFAGGEHIKKHQFHFHTDDGDDIYGSYVDAIGEDSPVTWPKRYRARFSRTVKTFYTRDKQDIATYVLLGFEPAS